jgi:hypothetical protein
MFAIASPAGVEVCTAVERDQISHLELRSRGDTVRWKPFFAERRVPARPKPDLHINL